MLASERDNLEFHGELNARVGNSMFEGSRKHVFDIHIFRIAVSGVSVLSMAIGLPGYLISSRDVIADVQSLCRSLLLLGALAPFHSVWHITNQWAARSHPQLWNRQILLGMR